MTRVLTIVRIERLLKVFKNGKNQAFSTLYSLFAELTGTSLFSRELSTHTIITL